MRKLVLIGGGTGSFALLSGLKHLADVDITAIVPSTDSGGSTGRLRDEFGYLPIGDVRQCLVALAEDEAEERLLRKLFAYRFDKGENGLRGHNLGNLLLTALTEILGNELLAIEQVQNLLRIKGHVYPVTLGKCDLVAEYANGSVIVGEHHIDEPSYPHDGREHITQLRLEPQVHIHDAVKQAIMQADLVVLAPGDLYTSLIANLVVAGMTETLQASPAKLVYVMNLITKFGQTFEFKASDHVRELENYAGRSLDFILLNSAKLPADILKKYVEENAAPVEDDLSHDRRVIRSNLLTNERIRTHKGDILKRSLIRHDGKKVASEIERLLV